MNRPDDKRPTPLTNGIRKVRGGTAGPTQASRGGTAPLAGVSDAMKLKMAIGREKVRSAIAADGGTTVYGAHLLPHTAPWFPGVLQSGMRMLEITHGAIYMEHNPPRTRVGSGGRYETLMSSYGVPVEELAKRIREIRPALSDIFLNVAAPGTFNQIGPAKFDERSAFLLSQAGADGIHCHQSNLDELAVLVELAHGSGLLVEAYINRFMGETNPFSYMGIPAETPREVRRAVRDMESIGVDTIGLMFSVDPKYYSQEGSTETLTSDVRDRIKALTAAATVPTSIEGQITPGNAREIRELGANILVLGTVFDLAIEEAIKRVVDEFSGRGPGSAARAAASRVGNDTSGASPHPTASRLPAR
jgi:hypothetical protein